MGFKPREDAAIRIGRQQEIHFDKQAFIESVFNQEYILVVGSRVIMGFHEEPSGDVNTYILRSVNRSLNARYDSFDDIIEHAGLNDPIRNLLNSQDDFSYDSADMSPELCKLLQTRLFPFVLTTTVDHYLETLMRGIWPQLRVVSIDDNASVKAWRDSLNACRENERYAEPTLFYIFGKADTNEKSHYVRTENDAIRIIEKWMKLPDNDPILQFIRAKKLLALGCKFEDWYFRTFWYILKHDFNRFAEGEVTLEFDENDRSDNNLKQYIERMRIFNHGDARAFMKNLLIDLTSLEPDNPFCAMVLNHRRKGGVFLSYSSDDSGPASQLFFQLCKEGYKVWYDNDNLKGGDPYNERINEAINASPVVITLLSPHITQDFRDGKKDKYYRKEWDLATQDSHTTIIPVAIDGYNLRSETQLQYESIIGRSVSGIDLLRPDGFHRLCESLDKHLGKQ